MTDERAELREIANKLAMLRHPCQVCNDRPATAGQIHLHANAALFVVRQETELNAELCTVCLHKQFARFTLINVLMGWWGIVSMVKTPGFILGNIAQYELGLRAASKYRKKLQSDIEQTIISARRRTGAPS